MIFSALSRSVADTKKTAFFSNNFSDTVWKNKAQKNAFVLLGKQRFEEGAAFFLLADKLWDAVEVCVSNLNDLQLAFVVIRLYEGDHGPIYQRFLKEFILGIPSSLTQEGRGHVTLQVNPDPFLRSMVYWLLQDCSNALETLLVNPEITENDTDPVFHTNPAIFNFYFYLRTHPFLVRRDHRNVTGSFLASHAHSTPSQKLSGKGFMSGVGDEPLTDVERGLLFSTAYYHLCHGCPLLVLNVLSRLPTSINLGGDSYGTEGEVEAGLGGESAAIPGGVLESMAGMIESGTLASHFTGGGVTEKKEEEDFDWGAPVSGQLRLNAEEEEEEIDWSKPLLPPGGQFNGSGGRGRRRIGANS